MSTAPERHGRGRITLWRVDLAAGDPADGLLLSADERARADAFVAEVHRDRFVAGRAALRRILGEAIGADPARLVFTAGRYGKPALVDPGAPSFNVSHSGDAMLCAVADVAGLVLGVDVEREIPDRDLAGIARRVFSPGEQRVYEATASARRVRAFYAGWTRKEACIKATGAGMSAPLQAFDVEIDPDVLASSTELPDLQGVRRRLSLRTLAPGEGLAAALAVEHSDPELVLRRWPDGGPWPEVRRR